MSKQKEVLRLKEKGLSERSIARVLKCSRNTVKKYLNPGTITEPELPAWVKLLDWNKIQEELGTGVPLNILWEERFEQQQIPVSYSAFWKQFNKKFPSLGMPTMIRRFNPGERVEIDYCDGIDILDVATGEIISTQLFVGVLCKSRYGFAEFTFSQKSLDFLSSHVRMFEFFGGVPATVTPDNLKSAVTKAHPYDPEKNPAYTRLAQHYDVAITPARVRTPKDKPIAERTIQIFQKWFYFKVRKRTFTSLTELNICLAEHLEIFNKKIHRVFKKSRSEMFMEEKEHLQDLPATAYQVASHKKATLQNDCHLQFDKSYYSAPWQHRGKRLDVWATDKLVEISFNGEKLAVHSRTYREYSFRTNDKHYPPSHQAYLEVTPSNLREKAKQIGDSTYELINGLMSVKHPLKHLRRAQGIVALAKKYSSQELEQACKKALLFDRNHVGFIEGLIKNLGSEPEETTIKRGPNPHLRGEELYH